MLSSSSSSSYFKFSRRLLQSHSYKQKHALGCMQRMPLSSSSSTNDALPQRERMHYDVVCVGAGPAGLSAAIRLKQLAIEKKIDLNICVVEKGAEVGAHILSGNVFEPKALDELFPDWQNMGAPLETKAGSDRFLVLSETSSIGLPNLLLPPQLHNDGNYIISLSKLVRWLAEQAEALGVEIYPGFAASLVLYDEEGAVRGVATKDVGIAKDGSKKDTFEQGIELIARNTLFAEGCRGSCSEEVMQRFKLRDTSVANKEVNVQTYGLGIKEVWQVPDDKFQKGYIQHTLGWPLQSSPFSQVFGGTFLYHMEPNLVLLGMVVGLDYQNPYLSPYKEFQRWKTHPEVSRHLEGGECISYGARCLNEGGYHSIPKLTFPGGALLGCGAGFLNSVKIKGSHTAMKSGMLAAEALYPLLTRAGEEGTVCAGGEEVFTAMNNGALEESIEAKAYEEALYGSWVAEELRPIRNTHASFHSPLGTVGGMAYTALSCFITKGSEPWTFYSNTPDSARTKLAKECEEIQYPKNDGILSFDLLTNLQRSGTSHDHDQPAHLRVKEEQVDTPSDVSIADYAGPEQRFCPAGVYEYTEAMVDPATGCMKRHLVINAQNCVHCKCCSIKTPKEYIRWTVPEGGGGPAYTVM